MKRKRLIEIFVLCSAVLGMLFSGAILVYAQSPSPAVIETYVIENIDGSDVTNGPLMAGATYTISLEVNVGVDLANTTLSLTTPMIKVEDVYWSLENDYPGIDTDLWQPGRATIEFNVVKGIAQFTLKGSVPSDYTSEKLSNGDYLHFIEFIPLVKLTLGPGDTLLDECSVEVRDQAIVAYQQTLTEKNSLLKTTDADPKYEDLATAIIALAEELNSQGYVEEATNLLNTLPSSASDFPVPVEEGSYMVYIVIIVVFAVIMLAFLTLFFRARANSSFIRQQIDEEAGRLDVLSVKLSKIDRQLARDIEQVKQQLERISGR
jgi:hypothetical protein